MGSLIGLSLHHIQPCIQNPDRQPRDKYSLQETCRKSPCLWIIFGRSSLVKSTCLWLLLPMLFLQNHLRTQQADPASPVSSPERPWKGRCDIFSSAVLEAHIALTTSVPLLDNFSLDLHWMTVSTLWAVPIMRRLSKSWLDGEDSFVDFSNSAGRRKVQHLIHPAIMVNRKVDVGMEVSPGSR